MKETPWSRIRGQNSVYKEFLEIVGNGKPTGSVLVETIAVSATISIAWKNDTAESVSEFFHAAESVKSIENPKSQRKKSQVVECLDGLARITSKELAITHSVQRWHPPECLFCKTKSGCRFGEKCSYAHRQVDEQPTKRSKKNDDKSAVAMLKKNDWYENVRELVVNHAKGHDRSGRPDKNRDHELKRGPTGRRSSNTRKLGCVFQDMKPPKSILRKSSDM